MRPLVAFIITLLIIESCQIKAKQSSDNNTFANTCNELNIYYNEDTLTYITKDTAIINLFSRLIMEHDELNGSIDNTCGTTQKLVFKNKGQQILTADISIKNSKDKLSCNYITYFLNSKMYRQRLTYRTGMAIDEIYSMMLRH